jgi:hypothetical protein
MLRAHKKGGNIPEASYADIVFYELIVISNKAAAETIEIYNYSYSCNYEKTHPVTETYFG